MLNVVWHFRATQRPDLFYFLCPLCGFAPQATHLSRRIVTVLPRVLLLMQSTLPEACAETCDAGLHDRFAHPSQRVHFILSRCARADSYLLAIRSFNSVTARAQQRERAAALLPQLYAGEFSSERKRRRRRKARGWKAKGKDEEVGREGDA